MSEISIVVPCYNEEEAIPIFYNAIKKVFATMKMSEELIFVDDGSTDGTLRVIKQLAAKDHCCKYLSFSRNFGKESAIYAGLKYSNGNYTAVMDVDLQDPPELLPKMYEILQKQDYNCVALKRKNRDGEPKIKSFLSDCFYKVINKISKTEIVPGARDFRLMSRKMLDAVLDLSEYNRFSKGIFGWVGFRTKWLEYEHVDRCAGDTKWPLRKLIAYSLEGITGFSVAPLSLASIMGVLFCGISFLMIFVIVIRTLLFGDPVAGWPSIACIIFLVGGVQLFCIGIVGEYLSKTYLEAKNRPIFILQESSYEAKVKAKGKGIKHEVA